MSHIFSGTFGRCDLVIPGQGTPLDHGYGKNYWDMNTLVSFAPPQHFENLANADSSWVFDATDLVWRDAIKVSARC
jgi:hypothetical protein